MQVKLKHCNGPCDKDKPIWKNIVVDGTRKRYCQSCWAVVNRELNGPAKPTERKSISRTQKPIPKRSEKRVKKDVAYSVLRKVFLEQHPVCMIAIPNVCSGQKATEIHHSFDGADRDKYYLDTSTWFSTERMCHDWCHSHPKEAKELGFLK